MIIARENSTGNCAEQNNKLDLLKINYSRRYIPDPLQTILGLLT